MVIDGQQRLTTISLIIEALARHVGNAEPLEGFSARKLRNYYLLNAEEDGEKRYKLLLTETDKESLLAIVQRKQLPDNSSLRIKENLAFFEEQIKRLKGNLKPLCKGLLRLMVVDISLEKGKDDPQLIFESMNSTGLDLSQADLIRNFILMDLEINEQTRLYKEYWRPMEKSFGQKDYDSHFNGFMRHYLTVKTDEIPKIPKVYEEFKKYARKPDIGGIEDLVNDIRKFSQYYCAIAFVGEEPNPALSAAFADLRELKVEVAYPLLLQLYDDYKSKLLTAEELEEIIRLVESYVFRRAVCAIPTNSLNKTFAGFNKTLVKDSYLESVKAKFLNLPSYRRFPGDGEFLRELQKRDIYNFRSRKYWLRRLENYERKEPITVNEYTVEHIMPQSLSDEWKRELGDNWEEIHENLLHTIGNLTLTGYNSEYSNHPFADKQNTEGGFKQSPLRLNIGLGNLENWDENAIRARAKKLASSAINVWSYPKLDPEILKKYHPKESQISNVYSIEHYSSLVSGSPTRDLFETLRQNILSIDPVIIEEFLKTYIAYKAETNFVGVVPQANTLKLMLNMEFDELDDPRKTARDVANVGRLGNGNVEVKLTSKEDLSYVMGLIRQAFEEQMENEEINLGLPFSF